MCYSFISTTKTYAAETVYKVLIFLWVTSYTNADVFLQKKVQRGGRNVFKNWKSCRMCHQYVGFKDYKRTLQKQPILLKIFVHFLLFLSCIQIKQNIIIKEMITKKYLPNKEPPFLGKLLNANCCLKCRTS